jgi:AcrR family transcriptional regulator
MSSKSKSDRVFSVQRREFAQERARRTYEALLQAAEEQFSEHGFDATQTPDVAAAAGVSVGTFYRYFSDKKEIFLDVLKKELSRGRDQVLRDLRPENFVGAARRETIERAMRVLVEDAYQGEGLQQTYLEMSLRDEDVAELRSAFEDAVCKQIAALISEICPREQVPDPTATAWVIMQATMQCAQRIASPSNKPSIDAERALAALTEMTYRALFGIDSE